MERTPQPHIRRLLRREVNFGCPVPSCGSPYLEYHHFDPPFSVHPHHNPEGMIALCTKHHPMADQNGKWTKEDLRRMKQTPFLRADKLTDDSFGWHRRELILAAGGFYVNPSIFLSLNGRQIIWCGRDEENRLQLSIDIRDQDDRSIVKMDENDWLEIGRISNIKDIEVSPRGRALAVRAPVLGVFLAIKFEECSAEKLRGLGQRWNMNLDNRPGPDTPYPEFMIKALEDGASHFNFDDRSKDSSFLRSVMTRQLPTRWELLTRSFQEWPVTVCTMSLKLKYPFAVQIHPGKENVGRWSAGHSIAYESQIVWDIQG